NEKRYANIEVRLEATHRQSAQGQSGTTENLPVLERHWTVHAARESGKAFVRGLESYERLDGKSARRAHSVAGDGVWTRELRTDETDVGNASSPRASATLRGGASPIPVPDPHGLIFREWYHFQRPLSDYLSSDWRDEQHTTKQRVEYLGTDTCDGQDCDV